MANSNELNYITLFTNNKIPDDDDDKLFKDNILEKFITDLELKKFSPDRYTFYKTLLEKFMKNQNPKTIFDIFKKYKRFQNIKDVEGEYLRLLSFYGEGSKNDNIIKEVDNIIYEHGTEYSPEEWKNAVEAIKKEQRTKKADSVIEVDEAKTSTSTSPADTVVEKANEAVKKADALVAAAADAAKKTTDTSKTVAAASGGKVVRGGTSADIGYQESKFKKLLRDDYDFKNIANLNTKIYGKSMNNRDKSSNNKLKEFNDNIDKYNDGDINNDEIKYRLKQFENDPEKPLKQLELTFDDRLVFIITTFFIRYISLIFIQWSIDINIIKSFEDGFLYYTIVYLAILWFIIFFVNIDNSSKVDYMNFDNIMNSIRSLFYYFYMGTNGITRLFIHTILICILLIIPIILNIKKTNEYDDEKKETIIDFDERKKLMKSLSLFTIYVWILTSIIATKF
jgi:hypothetical protein